MTGETNKPRVLFMGGKDIGCGCLDHMISEGINVVGAIINPLDMDRHRWYQSAAEIAIEHGIPAYCFEDINSTEAVLTIGILAPDLIVIVYYDQILKREIIDIPARGCVNLHMALAEEYRGCYPTTWVLMNGETQIGVTLHFVDDGIDSGDIIAQESVTIDWADTGKRLYQKCTDAGIELFQEHLSGLLSGIFTRTPQKTTDNTRYYSRVSFPSHQVTLDDTTYNQIRALTFHPFPPPYFYIGDRKMIIVPEDTVYL